MFKAVLTVVFFCSAGLVSLVESPLAHADIKSYEFSEPRMANRFVDLTTVLRCPKCQNQNLADSDPIIKIIY